LTRLAEARAAEGHGRKFLGFLVASVARMPGHRERSWMRRGELGLFLF
jgi:hypothetical protein